MVDSGLLQRPCLLRGCRRDAQSVYAGARQAIGLAAEAEADADFGAANGTSNAIVWAHENSNPAVLHAYDATNLAHELYNSNQAAHARDQFGAGNKFITPTIADGKVFVGTAAGVAIFGLLH